MNVEKLKNRSTSKFKIPKKSQIQLAEPLTARVTHSSLTHFPPSSSRFRESKRKKILESNLLFKSVINRNRDNSDIEITLKNSVNSYEDYKNIINPKASYIDSLCPMSLSKNHKSKNCKIMLFPKEDYDNYKKETMKLLKKTEFRIKQAKKMILIAKSMSKNI